MNEFTAVSMDELTQVEGGFDLGVVVAGAAGLVIGGLAGAIVSTVTYEVTKAATSPSKS